MANEIDMRTISLLRWDAWFEHGMRALGRATGWQQTKSCGNAVDMRIDREGRMPTGKEQHASDRFRPHPRKFRQQGPSGWHRQVHQKIQTQLTLARLQGAQNLLNPPALQPPKPTGTNHAGQVIRLSLLNLFPGVVCRPQGSVCPVGIDIARMLRQDRGDELSKGIVMGFPGRCPVGAVELLEDGTQTSSLGCRLVLEG
jgi:hypothetical protein